ncbi:MAG: hypothetical protein P8012_03330 [Desulfobacterales bacterium]
MEGSVKKIKGVLLPVNWDENGSVQDIALYADDENEYIIVKDTKSKEMIKLLRQEVELYGIVQRKKGKNIISVEGYSQKPGE